MTTALILYLVLQAATFTLAGIELWKDCHK
jgi:hypothetical protein